MLLQYGESVHKHVKSEPASRRGSIESGRVSCALHRGYEAETRTTVDLIYGSSGNFRAQIENGAPFDIFLSADELYPQQLVTDGLADAQSLVIYAQGHLVLWAPAGANFLAFIKGEEGRTWFDAAIVARKNAIKLAGAA